MAGKTTLSLLSGNKKGQTRVRFSTVQCNGAICHRSQSRVVFAHICIFGNKLQYN